MDEMNYKDACEADLIKYLREVGKGVVTFEEVYKHMCLYSPPYQYSTLTSGQFWVCDWLDSHLVSVAEDAYQNPYCKGEELVETNQHGGKGSDIGELWTAAPSAMRAIARVLSEGSKKYDTPGEPPNWYKVPVEENLNHALSHVFNFLTPRSTERVDKKEELSHALCRLAMAYEQYVNRRPKDVSSRQEPAQCDESPGSIEGGQS